MAVVGTPLSREKLLQIARSLPADLTVLSKVGDLLQDVNSELEAIAALLRRDIALATRIVRISNSAIFGGGGRIASVEEAVNRVGFSEILKLVGTATASRFSEHALEYHGISANLLRDNMLYGAAACEALAHTAGTDPRIAYTAGLLRPLGLMVLDRAVRSHLQSAERFATSRCTTYSAWEGGLFGVDNCEVAGLLLDEWRFPRELGRALRGHYLARSADIECPLACLINVANHLAQQSGRTLPGETDCWEISPLKLHGAGVTAEDLGPATVAADRAFAAAIAALAA